MICADHYKNNFLEKMCQLLISKASLVGIQDPGKVNTPEQLDSL